MLRWRVGLVVALSLAVALATAASASAKMLADPDCGKGFTGGYGGSGWQSGPGTGSSEPARGVTPDLGRPGWDGTGDPPAQPPGPPPPPISFEDDDRWCWIGAGDISGTCVKDPPPGETIVGSITFIHEHYNAATGNWDIVFSSTKYCYGHDDRPRPVQHGFGRIRAGCAEGGLTSDFTVDLECAVLGKRG